jgi:hypothetical protein
MLFGIFVGAASEFEEKQQTPSSPAGRFYDTPGEALKDALNEINSNAS